MYYSQDETDLRSGFALSRFRPAMDRLLSFSSTLYARGLAFAIAVTLIIQFVFMLFAVSTIERNQLLAPANLIQQAILTRMNEENVDLRCIDRKDGIFLRSGESLSAADSDVTRDGDRDLAKRFGLLGIYLISLGSDSCKETLFSASDGRERPLEEHLIKFGNNDVLGQLQLSLKIAGLSLFGRSDLGYIVQLPIGAQGFIHIGIEKQFISMYSGRFLNLYLIVAAVVLLLNSLFVYHLVRSFISKPLRKIRREVGQLVEASTEHRPQSESSRYEAKEISDIRRELAKARRKLLPRAVLRRRSNGVLHDMRNDLQSLFSLLSLISRKKDLDRIERHYRNQISYSMERVIQFVTSEPTELRLGRVKLQSLFAKAIYEQRQVCLASMAQDSDKKVNEIEFVSECPDDLEVLVDVSEFERILKNLLMNSVEALKNKVAVDDLQEIIARSSRKHEKFLINRIRYNQSEDFVRLTGYSSGGMVKILVEDNGRGIRASRRQTIFHVGESDSGSPLRGIGLDQVSIVLGDHGGTVRVLRSRYVDDVVSDVLKKVALSGESEEVIDVEETGTVFEITLPAADRG